MRSSGKKRVETGDLNDTMMMNEIMLKYRPIAPKPVTITRSVSMPLKERAKRKYVRVKKKKINYDDDKWTLKGCNGSSEFVVTETDSVTTDPVPIQWLTFDPSEKNNYNNNEIATAAIDLHEVDLSMKAKRGHVVESWITVESVTSEFEDWRRRCTDEEIWKDLEMDSCPGFISNGCFEVKWVNLAYRMMVDPNHDGESMIIPEVVVVLEVKMENLSMVEYWPAFSCRVRVVYRLSEKTKKMTVPCDVWKMDSGEYAWRLDVNAALSLGRLN